jgi:hypothetical protein
MTVTTADPRSYFSRVIADLVTNGEQTATGPHDTLAPGNGEAFKPGDGDLGVVDFFAGCGGSMSGMASIPGVYPVLAANHWQQAIDSHSQNFPSADHYRGDIRNINDLGSRLPAGDIFWASPECPKWSQARGQKRDYHEQPGMIEELEPLRPEADERSRALMWDVPRYLDAMKRRGKPVKAGVVENVVDVRAWHEWGEWRRSIEKLGYESKLIALNSMHAQSVKAPAPPSPVTGCTSRTGSRASAAPRTGTVGSAPPPGAPTATRW